VPPALHFARDGDSEACEPLLASAESSLCLHVCACLSFHVTCRCAPGFYLAKPYSSSSNGLTGCATGFFNTHDLGDNEGRVKCVIGDSNGANKYDYRFNSTCVACGAGKFLDTAGN
jgi:hypothetical protein